MARMIFVCQVVDENHPISAIAAQWIKEFANHPQIKWLTVITLRKGVFKLPENVEVVAIQQNRNHLITIFNFYKEVVKRVSQTDCFFIHMGGPYPLLLLPFGLLMKKPIYQWKTRTHVGPMMKFYAYFCDDKIFTASRNSFPLPIAKVKVVGHGINVKQFNIKDSGKKRDFVVTGRITPIKQLAEIIKFLHSYNKRYNTVYDLDIWGPVLTKDRKYKQQLEELIDDLNLNQLVHFRGVARYDQMPEILNGYRFFISFNKSGEGGLDKSVLEAMACGLPAITPNVCVAEILTPDLRDLLIIPEDDIEQQIKQINHLLFLKSDQLSFIGRKLRKIVEENHNLPGLVDKIIMEINS